MVMLLNAKDCHCGVCTGGRRAPKGYFGGTTCPCKCHTLKGKEQEDFVKARQDEIIEDMERGFRALQPGEAVAEPSLVRELLEVIETDPSDLAPLEQDAFESQRSQAIKRARASLNPQPNNPMAKWPFDQAKELICPRCKCDRLKEPCPNTMDCPMVAVAQGTSPS